MTRRAARSGSGLANGVEVRRAYRTPPAPPRARPHENRGWLGKFQGTNTAAQCSSAPAPAGSAPAREKMAVAAGAADTCARGIYGRQSTRPGRVAARAGERQGCVLVVVCMVVVVVVVVVVAVVVVAVVVVDVVVVVVVVMVVVVVLVTVVVGAQ